MPLTASHRMFVFLENHARSSPNCLAKIVKYQYWNIEFQTKWKKYNVEQSMSKVHRELIQIPEIELFWENSKRLKAVDYFCKNIYLICFTGVWIRLAMCSSPELFVSGLNFWMPLRNDCVKHARMWVSLDPYFPV